MKKTKFLLLSMVMLLSVALLIGCKPDDVEIEEIKITLSETEVTVEVGEELDIVATVTGSEEALTWTSSNETIVTVTDAKITAIKAGTAEVTATLGEKSAKVTVTVVNAPFPVLTVSQDQVELIKGNDGITVVPTLKLDGSEVTATYTWVVDDDNVATVVDGLITAVNPGETTVTVSTTYEGDYVEKDITVIVNIDAAIVISENEITLDAVDVDGSQVTSTELTFETYLNNVEVTDKSVLVEGGDDVVTATIVEGKLSLVAEKPGQTDVTVYFMQDGIKVSSDISVTVDYVTIVVAENIHVDLSSEDANVLNLDALNISETILDITKDDESISSENNATTLIDSVISSAAVGDEIQVIILTQNIKYEANIAFINNYREVVMFSAENGNESSYELYDGDVATLGYEAGTDVYEFNTGTIAGAWASRLQTTEPLTGYDWWMMDIMFSEVPTGEITLWIGMFHVVTISPNGVATLLEEGSNFTGNQSAYDSVTVYNENGERQTTTMEANEVYTIAISLEYRDSDPRDSFGLNAATTVYLSNIYAASQAYYDENFAPTLAEELLTYDVTFDLTEDNNVGATYVYDETAEAYVLNTGTLTSSWANRIQTTDPEIQKYDYMFFNIMLSAPLSASMDIWMDMLSVTSLGADGNATSELLYIVNEDNELVTSALEAGVIYTFIIELKHEDVDGRYAFGFNQETIIYIRNAFAASKAFVETYSANNDLAIIESETLDISLDLTADNNVGASYVYNEEAQAFVFNTGTSTSSWANRLQTTDVNMPSYDYLFFDLMLTETLSAPVHFWMDMLSVTTMQADGTIDTNFVYIINSNNELVSGPLEAGQIYTIAIRLGHEDAEGRYAFGFNQDTMVYVRNVFAAKESYVLALMETLTMPDNGEPINVDFALTAENTNGATFTAFEGDETSLGFESGSVVYTYYTGDTANLWGSRLETNQEEIRSRDVMIFDLVIYDALSESAAFWMDMNSVTVLSADGTRDTTDLLYIFDQDGNVVTTALNPDTVYTVAIVLGHEGAEVRYAFGFGEVTTVYIADVQVVEMDVLTAMLEK